MQSKLLEQLNTYYPNLNAALAPDPLGHLKKGDLLFRDVNGFPLLDHLGCYAGRDIFGNHWVFEHTKEGGTRVVLWQQFSLGKAVRWKRLSEQSRPAALVRMKQLLENPKKYNEIQFNCEHAARFVTEGKAYSLQAIAFLAFAGLVTYAAIKSGAA